METTYPCLWKCKDGRLMSITEMTHTHLINSIKLLEKGGLALTGTNIILVKNSKYPYLVIEAITRNLLANPHNGVDIRISEMSRQVQVRGTIPTEVLSEPLIEDRKITFDL